MTKNDKIKYLLEELADKDQKIIEKNKTINQQEITIDQIDEEKQQKEKQIKHLTEEIEELKEEEGLKKPKHLENNNQNKNDSKTK